MQGKRRLWKAKMFYRISSRLPARFHGIEKRTPTEKLLRLSEEWEKEYSQALQACLEGRRPVHASELNHPLMMWNASWQILHRRLFGAMPWGFRKQLLIHNMSLLENPTEKQLWALVDLWMQAREETDHIRQQLEKPVLGREHSPREWKSTHTDID
jgi:hypothetical protein